MEALQRAIILFGGQRYLAEKLGVQQPAISNWLIRKHIPPKQAIAIEYATQGRVKRHELSDLFAIPAARRVPRKQK